jgi:type IV pilus assembly protein PilC
MPIFEFKAKDNLGVEKSGSVEAQSKDAALSLLQNQNLIVVSIKERNPSIIESLVSFGGVGKDDLVEFSRQFATMINSGLTITRSLGICIEQASNPNFRKILQEVLKDIDAGTSLSGALSRYPMVFDAPYTSLIRAGESSGKLDAIMSRIADTYEANRDLEARLKSALIYPGIIMAVTFLVIVILIVYVIPKLTEVFESLDRPLPWFTQMLVNLSGFVINFWYLIIAGIIGLGFFLKYYLSTETGRMTYSVFLMNLPVIGKVIKQTELSNYMRTLSLLLSSGVQITESLIIASRVSSNPIIINSSLEASKYVEKGNNLSDYLRSNKFFDPIIPSMVKIGEETGQVDELVNKIAINYSNESGHAIKGLSSAIEPLILVVQGVFVGGIILSVIIPIFSIIGTVGGN